MLAVDGFIEAKMTGALFSDIEFVLQDELEELFVCEVVADGFLKPQVETDWKPDRLAHL